jgi:hypothetical protein
MAEVAGFLQRWWCARAEGRSAIRHRPPDRPRAGQRRTSTPEGWRLMDQMGVSPGIGPSTKTSRKQRFHERIRVKRLQIVEAFPDADELHGQVDRLANGDHDTALGGAIELGQDDAGAAD